MIKKIRMTKTGIRAKTKKFITVFAGLIIVLLASYMGCTVNHPVNSFEQAEVVRVVDGDTIKIDRGNGNETVRLIGINAPESVHPDASKNTQEGMESSDHLKSMLKEGDIIWLESDVSDTDQYDRLLRYVWLVEPTDTVDDSFAKTNMLNAVLVSEGYANAKDYPPDTKWSTLLHSL